MSVSESPAESRRHHGQRTGGDRLALHGEWFYHGNVAIGPEKGCPASMYSAAHQFRFDFASPQPSRLPGSCRDRFAALLESDLDCHTPSSSYASPNLHAFRAKFALQFPRTSTEPRTEPGDSVSGAMTGSGATVGEATLGGRRALGSDIDPLALRISPVKTTPLPFDEVRATGRQVLHRAAQRVHNECCELAQELNTVWDTGIREFAAYWLCRETQMELRALASEVRKVTEPHARGFLELVFSSLIIAKPGGVSRALDHACTRRHRWADKPQCSVLAEFRKRLDRNLSDAAEVQKSTGAAQLAYADCHASPFDSAVVDSAVTSPPYASTAVDCMRAHKLPLIRLGDGVDHRAKLGPVHIGGGSTKSFRSEDLATRPEPWWRRSTVRTMGKARSPTGTIPK